MSLADFPRLVRPAVEVLLLSAVCEIYLLGNFILYLYEEWMNESNNQLSISNLWGAVITAPVQTSSILLNMSPRQMNQILIVLGNLSNNTVYIELRVCMFAY